MFPNPSYYIHLTVSSEDLRRRLSKRDEIDLFEKSIFFQKAVKERYVHYFKNMTDAMCFTFDTSRNDIEAVHNLVKSTLGKFI